MDSPAVIIDPGSCTLKAGFPGDAPSVEFPSIIARIRSSQGCPVYGRKDGEYIGPDAVGKRGSCALKYPIEHGFVVDWNDYELLIRYALTNSLRINPQDHPLLITEHPKNPKCNTEKTVELAFESLSVPSLCVRNTSVLSLYAENMHSGLAVELGDGTFNISTVLNGRLLQDFCPRVPWSGRYITDLLSKEISKDTSAATSEQRDMLRRSMFWDTLSDIKHKCCFVSQDFERDLLPPAADVLAVKYEMPDGTDLKLTTERIIAPECIFKPSLIGIEMYGMHQQINDALKRADDDIKNKMLSNIVISGGCSLFPGLPERFQKELELLNDKTQKINIISSANRKYSAWIGGSKLASNMPRDQFWVTKEEYDDIGPTAVLRKR